MFKQSPEHLIVRRNRLTASRLLRDFLVVGLGLGFLLLTGPAKLDCQRLDAGQVTCQLTKPGWVGLRRWDAQAIANLQNVELLQMEDEGVFYQILLKTSAGEIPLRPYKTSGLDNTLETVQQLQAFLEDSTATHLVVAQWDWLQWFGLIPGLVLSLAGLRSLSVFFFSVRHRTIESYCFEQVQGTFVHQFGSFLRKRQTVYSFFDIQRIVLDIHPQATACLLLELQSGKILCLNAPTPSPAASSPQTIAIAVATANEISQRVGRPWQMTLGFRQSWLQKAADQDPVLQREWRQLDATWQSSGVWIFDRTTHRLTHQQAHAIKTYPLETATDVQVVPMGELVERKDSEGTPCYDVNVAVYLVTAKNQRILIQKFYSLEYKFRWKQEKGELSRAHQQAEAIAHPLRQYLHPYWALD